MLSSNYKRVQLLRSEAFWRSFCYFRKPTFKDRSFTVMESYIPFLPTWVSAATTKIVTYNTINQAIHSYTDRIARQIKEFLLCFFRSSWQRSNYRQSLAIELLAMHLPTPSQLKGTTIFKNRLFKIASVIYRSAGLSLPILGSFRCTFFQNTPFGVINNHGYQF